MSWESLWKSKIKTRRKFAGESICSPSMCRPSCLGGSDVWRDLRRLAFVSPFCHNGSVRKDSLLSGSIQAGPEKEVCS